MSRQAKTTRARGRTAADASGERASGAGRAAASRGRKSDGAAADPAAGRRRQMTVDDIAQSVGRSADGAAAGQPQRPMFAAIRRWLIQTPLGRLIFGILIAALILAAVLLAVGNQFDRFYLVLGLLLLLAAGIRWIFFIRHGAMRQTARPGSEDAALPDIVNKK